MPSVHLLATVPLEETVIRREVVNAPPLVDVIVYFSGTVAPVPRLLTLIRAVFESPGIIPDLPSSLKFRDLVKVGWAVLFNCRLIDPVVMFPEVAVAEDVQAASVVTPPTPSTIPSASSARKRVLVNR